MYKDLIPVSIKLESTIKTEKAKKIIRKAEKDLLQARVKAINSILDNISKQTELCRSQLASILSTQRLRECQGSVEKVGEIRFTKVKQRQLNKFNNLLNKKEGNITRVSTQHNSSQGLVASQAGRQASTQLPPGEGSNLASQACSQADAHLPLREGSSLASQAGRQAGAHLPLREGSTLASQASRQAVTQAVSHLPREEALPPRQAVQSPLTLLQGKTLPRQVTTPSNQAGSQAVTWSGRQSTRCSARHRLPRLLRGTVLPPRQTALVPRKTTHLLPLNRLPQGSSSEDSNPKWVINLSSKPLTPAQKLVLAKGPSFVVSPRQPPNLDYITAIEAACTKLSQQDAEELRADINWVHEAFPSP